jgi:hypothetical protein
LADLLGLLLGEKWAHRLARIVESRIVWVDFHLGQEAGHVAGIVGLSQGVLHGLHEQVGDAALGVGHTDVQGHGRDPVPGQGLAHQDLAHHRTVAVGDHQLVVHLCQGQERMGCLGGDLHLLLGGALDVLGMGGVAADRHQHSRRELAFIMHRPPPSPVRV